MDRRRDRMRHLALICNSGILHDIYLQWKFYCSLNKVRVSECRNEGNEAVLGSLWQYNQEALGLDETQKTQEYFLENFVWTFRNWTHAKDCIGATVLLKPLKVRVAYTESVARVW